MNIGMLTEADWFEFEQRFGSATSWMRGRTLVRELLYLRSVTGPTPWQQTRLADLEGFTSIQELVTHYEQERAEGLALRMHLSQDDEPLIWRPVSLESWPQVLQQFPYCTKVGQLRAFGDFTSLYCVGAVMGGEARLYGVTR